MKTTLCTALAIVISGLLSDIARADDPMAVVIYEDEIRLEFRLGFMNSARSEPRFQRNEPFDMTLMLNPLRSGSFPALAEDITFVVSDDAGNPGADCGRNLDVPGCPSGPR